jgi:hypothetical protein
MTEQIRISNIHEYNMEIDGDDVIFTKKQIPTQFITEEEINTTDITHSTIIECVIKKGDEIIPNNQKFFSVLMSIWELMPTSQLLQNTTFNMKLIHQDGYKGYHWCPSINMYVQRKNAKGTLKEIIHMIKLNRLSMNLSIQLETGKIIHFAI